MFREWGFLLGEIWVLLALAALIGLFAGWLIWGRSSTVAAPAAAGGGADTSRLDAALAECQAAGASSADRIAELQSQLASAEDRIRVSAETAREAVARAAAAETASLSPVLAAPAAALLAAAEPVEIEPMAVAVDEPAPEAPVPVEMTRPETLTAARDGQADDLKLIKGIGPKMEALCHRLGFFHFDQIAAWTPAELAWVDANLEDFKGRATRDNWIGQARELAAAKG